MKRKKERAARPTYVYGVQPVLEAIRGGLAERILLARGEGGKTQEIRALGESARIPIVKTTKEELTRQCGSENHQGVLADVGTRTQEHADLGAIVDAAVAAGEEPLILLLDGIQDPQNLGAIMRSAWALGVHAVVLPKLRAAHVTPAVVRASAGAALMLPTVIVTNLKQSVDELKEHGVWIASAVMDGQPAYEARLDGPIGLVIGGETGVRPSLAEKCDLQVSIPLARAFDSLNASVAAGVLLYEIVRQRGQG